MSWLLVCGKKDLSLEEQVRKNSEDSLKRNGFSRQSLEYIRNLDRSISLSADGAQLDPVYLEKLRALCKYWECDAKMGEISSHRRIIGPLIVAFKKMLFSVISVLLRPFFEKQRNFNAQLIEILAHSAVRAGKHHSSVDHDSRHLQDR